MHIALNKSSYCNLKAFMGCWIIKIIIHKIVLLKKRLLKKLKIVLRHVLTPIKKLVNFFYIINNKHITLKKNHCIRNILQKKIKIFNIFNIITVKQCINNSLLYALNINSLPIRIN